MTTAGDIGRANEWQNAFVVTYSKSPVTLATIAIEINGEHGLLSH
jgi:hypothetical protein